MELDRRAREQILAKVLRLVEEKFFDPKFDFAGWRAGVSEQTEQLLSCPTADEFEQRLHDLVAGLRVSHANFFHSSAKRVPSRLAIGATLQKCVTGGEAVWVFQDVHEGGPAALAGVRRGDILVSVNGTAAKPPEAPTFAMGTTVPVTVRRSDGQTAELSVGVPIPRTRKLPYAEPRIVSHSIPRPGTGLLKASVFPGAIGIDVARALDAAVSELQQCKRLVVDLRGNPGGGIGGLRLMSYLTPDRLPVGYSLTRRRAQDGYDKNTLRKFGRIPASKWELVPLAFQFAFAEKSIALVTEGLGPQPFHGAMAVLINEHTASAAEMIAAFAAENHLATIVGTRSAGRLLSADSFKLPYGYVLSLPVGAYYTWGGRLLEGSGVKPDVEVELSYEGVGQGVDTQLNAALDFVESGSLKT